MAVPKISAISQRTNKNQKLINFRRFSDDLKAAEMWRITIAQGVFAKRTGAVVYTTHVGPGTETVALGALMVWSALVVAE